MSELKYCPFCGGEAEVAYSNDNHKQPYIRCKFGVTENPKCPASNMYQWQFHSLDEAIKAWNTRAPMANIVEKLEKLKMRYFLTLANTGDDKNDFAYENVGNALDHAINIVKQEINNGLE